MIKEKELGQARDQIRFKDGAGITTVSLRQALQKQANENGVPVSFDYDTVKMGGLIGGSTVDCLTIRNPGHMHDYWYFVVRVTHQGKYAFVDVDMAGSSKQHGKEAASQDAKALFAAGNLSSYGKGAMIGSALRSLGKSKAKLEEEDNWYNMVNDIFDDLDL